MTCLNLKTLMLTGLVLASSVGLAHAEADYRDAVQSAGGQIVHSTNGNCVRTQWLNDENVCGPHCAEQQTVKQQTVVQQRKARPAAGLTREERTVYFAFDRANLSPEAQARLDTLAGVLKSDQSVKQARIVGYADRIGTETYNERLSQKRAQTVRDYLIAKGTTTARVTETRWVGESEPSTNCPAEARSQLIACLQNDRRVEVEIDLFPEGQRPDAH